jgi:hypothetical protein
MLWTWRLLAMPQTVSPGSTSEVIKESASHCDHAGLNDHENLRRRAEMRDSNNSRESRSSSRQNRLNGNMQLTLSLSLYVVLYDYSISHTGIDSQLE